MLVQCTVCLNFKTPDEFSKDKRKRNGLQSHCQECKNFQAVLSKGSHKCKICGTKFPRRGLKMGGINGYRFCSLECREENYIRTAPRRRLSAKQKYSKDEQFRKAESIRKAQWYKNKKL